MDAIVDPGPLKEIQKFLWSQGDFAGLAEQSLCAADALVRAAGVGGGARVLDVGAGTGNVAVAALRAGACVTASDLTPLMVERGLARTGPEVVWVEAEAEAEALPFEDGAFDCALSCFGAMFAPRPEIAAGELARVVRPGGRVGLTAWTPGGYTGQLMATIASFMPPRPAGVPGPTEWGEEAVVRERLSGLRNVVVQRRAVRFEYPSVDAMLAVQRATLGPLIAATMVLGDRADALHDAIRALVLTLAGGEGPVRIDSATWSSSPPSVDEVAQVACDRVVLPDHPASPSLTPKRSWVSA